MKVSEETVGEKEQKRFLEAAKSLKKIEEEIAPFVEKRSAQDNLIVGEWVETTSLYWS